MSVYGVLYFVIGRRERSRRLVGDVIQVLSDHDTDGRAGFWEGEFLLEVGSGRDLVVEAVGRFRVVPDVCCRWIGDRGRCHSILYGTIQVLNIILRYESFLAGCIPRL